MDAAASKLNAKCRRFWNKEVDGLRQDWSSEVVWVNPPWSKIDPWVEKALERESETTVLLLPSRTDRPWFHRLYDESGPEYEVGSVQIEFLRSRTRFIDPLPGAKRNNPREAALIAVVH